MAHVTNAPNDESNGEAAAHTGKEIAALVRAANSGANVDPLEVWRTFERMAASTASTPSDALALLSIARLLVTDTVRSLNVKPDSTDGFSIGWSMELMDRAISVLEQLTGDRQTEFTGHAPALN